MRRGPDGRRMNGRDRALSEAFVKIFPERASFELRDDDVDLLRKQLEKGGQISNLPAFLQLQRDAEETAAWKVGILPSSPFPHAVCPIVIILSRKARGALYQAPCPETCNNSSEKVESWLSLHCKLFNKRRKHGGNTTKGFGKKKGSFELFSQGTVVFAAQHMLNYSAGFRMISSDHI